MTTTETLKQTEAAYKAAFAASEIVRERRNALVRQAAEEGVKHAEIGRITGLSRARIGILCRPEGVAQ